MTEGLAILVPVLRRPHRVRPLVESIIKATPEPWHVLFVADPDDLAEQEAIRDTQELWLQYRIGRLQSQGNYARKINEGVARTDEPLIFLGADDLEFHPGWLEAAAAQLAPGIGVVGTNDLCNAKVMAGEHATHSLITREYAERGTIDEPGKALHEGYAHEWVDNEFVETARHRGAWAFAEDSIVEHLHPMAGKAPMDDLYAGARQRMRTGRQLYLKRRPLWG